MSFDTMAMIALPMVVGGIILGVDIMRLVAGDAFAISGSVLRILMIATLFIFLSNVFTHVIVALDQQKKMMYGFASVAALALVGYLLLIPLYSFWGAAWMTVVAEGLVFLVSFFMVYRITGFVPSFHRVLVSFFASLIMAVFIVFFDALQYPLVLTILVSGLIYLVALIFLRGISKEFVWNIIKGK